MKKTDALWLLALPIHQILGTARHELSHAAVAALQGATVTHIRIFPSFEQEGGFLWGYVCYTGGATTWLVSAAPYFSDIIFTVSFLIVCTVFARMPRWLWINCFILGLVHPLLDIVYNYQKLFWRPPHGDINCLTWVFPNGLVHAACLGAILFCAVCVWIALRTFHRAQKRKREQARAGACGGES